MNRVTMVADVRAWRQGDDGNVGLVPTMGYLHAGHLALVERACRDCQRVAVSIFVNPSQFNRVDDLQAYPRDLERDCELVAAAGADLVFAPTPDEVYPASFQTWVEPGPVAQPNEGAHRPGHFRGVATVVLKLLNIFQPRRAYFGQKDAQQLAVIRSMVHDFDLPVEVEAVATVREPDGLAMSSRNVRLRAEERRAATVLFRALSAARDAFDSGEHDAEALRLAMRRALTGEPLAKVDYVSVADPQTLVELTVVDGPALLSLAVEIGSARLIDNFLLEEPS